MALFSTIAQLGNTALNASTLLSDTVDSAAKWVGLSKITSNTAYEDQLYVNDDAGTIAGKFEDLRGRSSVYRSSSTSYIKSLILNGRSSFKSTYDMTRGDFCWKQSAYTGKESQDYQPKVQKIRICEFQPYQQTFLGQLMKAGFASLAAGGIGSVIGSLQACMLGFLTKIFSGNSTNFLSKILKNAMIKQYASDPSSLYDNTSQLTLLNPYAAIQNIFTDGVFLHSFIIPFISDQPFKYLSQDTTYFQPGVGGSLKNLAEDLSFGKQMQDAFTGMTSQIFKNIPATPTFKNQLDLRTDNLTTSFYLLNKNSEYLVRNYRFLHALAAGAYVVQMPFGILQSPNVYYVEVIGKRQMIWAQMTINVTQHGKYRCDEYATQKIYSETGSKLFNTSNNGYKNMLWPQMWKVTITFHDFTPNTFNSYEHYMTNGSCLTYLSTDASSIVSNYSKLSNVANVVKTITQTNL